MLPGVIWDPSPLARMLPATAPDPALAYQGGIPVEGGVAFVPVPGPPGRPGLDGSVAATLPWSNITDTPSTFTPTTYTHVQTEASAVWTIVHNLGYPPTVQARTTGGLVFEVEELHLSPDVVQLRLAVPFAGSARLI